MKFSTSRKLSGAWILYVEIEENDKLPKQLENNRDWNYTNEKEAVREYRLFYDSFPAMCMGIVSLLREQWHIDNF